LLLLSRFLILFLYFQSLFQPLSTEEFIAQQRGQVRVGNIGTGGGAAFTNRTQGSRLGGAAPGNAARRTGTNVVGMNNYQSCEHHFLLFAFFFSFLSFFQKAAMQAFFLPGRHTSPLCVLPTQADPVEE
jgi:hypothetical protein